jgi:Protein of unknown function (DUF2442)
MSTSVLEISVPAANRVTVTGETLAAELDDGRAISVPIAWFPRLAHATDAERRNWRLIGGGQGIHWDDLDEDISIESLIAGRASAETQASLAEWLKSRKQKHA